MKFEEVLHEKYGANPEIQLNWKEVFSRIFWDMGIFTNEKELEKSISALLHEYIHDCVAQEYTHEILILLKRRKKNVYIVSNVTGPSSIFRKHLEIMGIAPYIDRSFFSSDFPYRKPSVEYFKMVMEETGNKIEDSVFIGDKEKADILGANRIGMQSILITKEEGISSNATYVCTKESISKKIEEISR